MIVVGAQHQPKVVDTQRRVGDVVTIRSSVSRGLKCGDYIVTVVVTMKSLCNLVTAGIVFI